MNQERIQFEMGQVCGALYRNYKGETEPRRFVPMKIFYGDNQWHPEPGWLLMAYDLERNAIRTFALDGFLTPPPQKQENTHP